MCTILYQNSIVLEKLATFFREILFWRARYVTSSAPLPVTQLQVLYGARNTTLIIYQN